MNVLLVHKNPELAEVLEKAYGELNAHKEGTEDFRPIEIFTARNARHADNYFVDLTDVDAVFIGFDLPGLRDTIMSGLVKQFAQSGFGFGKKPLIAVSLHNNNRLKQAGCNYEADGDGLDFRLVLQQLMLDRHPVKEMSRTYV